MGSALLPSSCRDPVFSSRSLHISQLCRDTSLLPSSIVNATMAGFEAGKGRKGKNFTAEEETCLCRSFLAVSQDPVCGNRQRNTAFWERITSHFNRTKARGNPVRPSRSLETKWGNIKHDVSKFCGNYKQVLDCRESGTSMDDVLERALEFYKDKHPKQQGFAFLHCGILLREVPRWWESPLDVQRRGHAGEGSPGAPSTTACRVAVPSHPQQEGDAEISLDGEGGNTEGETGGSVETAARLLLRSRGQKAAKLELVETGRRDSILKTQARATEQMAAANMVKAEAMMDHSAMSLFRMNMDDLDEDAREYFHLRRRQEMDRIKRKMESEKRVAEREKAEHEKLMQERAAEAQGGKRAAVAQGGKRPRTALSTPTAASIMPPSAAVAIRSTSAPAPTIFGTPTSTPGTSMLPPTSPEHSPMPEDGQGEYWEDSICIPDTQQQPQSPSFEPRYTHSKNEIIESQEFEYRNFGQGLDLNNRFYSE